MKATVELSQLSDAATGLSRPECVLCLRDGGLLVSHLGAGVLHIAPDGTRRVIGNALQVEGQAFVPNGIALLPGGDLLVANMGPGGGVWRLRADGALHPEVREVEGRSLPATNFVLADGDRTWISVSTTRSPISRAFSSSVADGFILVRDARGTRVVADGLAFANEMRLDAQGKYLYVAETFAHRVSRFRVDGDGLGERQTFADLGSDHYPDGLAFDAEEGLWVTSIISNRVLRVDPRGVCSVVIDDSVMDDLRSFQLRLQAGSASREDVQSQRGARLRNVSSIAFGGPDLRTAYLGSLGGDTVFAFSSPVQGLRPAHWHQHFPH